jgi:hypothetical protein
MAKEIISQGGADAGKLIPVEKTAITNMLTATALLKSVELTEEQITTWIAAIEKDIAKYKIDPDKVLKALDNLRFKHSNYSGLDYADFAEDCREESLCSRRTVNRERYRALAGEEKDLQKSITDYGNQQNDFTGQLKKQLADLQAEKAELEKLPEVKDLIARKEQK